MKTEEAARFVIARLDAGESVEKVKAEIAASGVEWHAVSAKAYQMHLRRAEQNRAKRLEQPNVAGESNASVLHFLELNLRLADFALCLSPVSNRRDLNEVERLLPRMPEAEGELVAALEDSTLGPHIRAQQNVGRIRHFAAFKPFAHLVEAATLCYYRHNYPSAYLTLVPVIEGVLLRWSGYDGVGVKPSFNFFKSFFRSGHLRQPCPANAQFHQIFSKACDKILNEHLFKTSHEGGAYSQFNRHQAAHLLRDTEFATRSNCIRLFLLIDSMTELYWYETGCKDPRWELRPADIAVEEGFYLEIQAGLALGDEPELELLRRPTL